MATQRKTDKLSPAQKKRDTVAKNAIKQKKQTAVVKKKAANASKPKPKSTDKLSPAQKVKDAKKSANTLRKKRAAQKKAQSAKKAAKPGPFGRAVRAYVKQANKKN